MTSRPRGALRALAADALQGLRARRRRLALSATSVFAACPSWTVSAPASAVRFARTSC